MKRKTTASLAAKWKKAFSGSNAKPVEDETHQQQDGLEPKGDSLALVKKEPITFLLSRFENPDDFERMLFVVKACARNGSIPFKNVIHVEQTRTGSRLVATDGLRLHVAEISKKIKGGEYKPHIARDAISLGKPLEGVKFPAWAKAIPKNTEKRGVINLANSGMGKDREETEKLSIAFNSFVKQTGEPVNIRYLEDLTKREWAIYCQNGKRKAIVLKEKSGSMESLRTKGPLAVILPIPHAA
jgi:hypothetical protein